MVRIFFAILFLLFMIRGASAQDTTDQGPKSANLLQLPNAPQGLIPGKYPLYVLMNTPKIVAELGLTEDQMAKWKVVQEKQKEVRKKYDDRMNRELAAIRERLKVALNDKDLDERAKLENLRKEQMTELIYANDQQLLKILTHKQEVRLKQIRLQAEGPSAFEREDVQVALSLLPEQVVEIQKAIFRGMRKLSIAANIPGNSDPKGANQKTIIDNKSKEPAVKKAHSNIAGARVDTMQAIEKILTGPQRKVYRNLIGEPFDFLGLSEKEEEKAKQQDARHQDSTK